MNKDRRNRTKQTANVMMKITTICIAILSALQCQAIKIWGIESLTPKQQVKDQIIARYGVISVVDNGDKISVYNPIIGGIEFNLCELGFNIIEDQSRFNEIIFQAWFEKGKVTEAKNKRDAVMNIIKRKYEKDFYVEYINDDGFKGCEFGMTDCGSVGHLEVIRDVGNDGTERIYVLLVYHPFDRDAKYDEF